MDVVIQDEKDDLPEEHARFLSGRMTASNLRLSLIIGTQRYHGAGQNLAFTEGTQHIGLVACPKCARRHNPETLWPGICRLRLPNMPDSQSPQLTLEGHFVRPEETSNLDGINGMNQIGEGRSSGSNESISTGQRVPEAAPESKTSVRFSSSENLVHSVNSVKNAVIDSALPIPFTPGQSYYLGCPNCGAELDRANPEWHPLAPERVEQRRWSYRLSQLLFPDIDLAQIVAAWQLAIRDPAHMTVFCTDRLALPKSSTQTLTPHDLQAARANYRLATLNLDRINTINGIGGKEPMSKSEYSIGFSDDPSLPNPVNQINPIQNSVCYGGLDLGDQCWFVARAVDVRPPHLARLLWIEAISAERVRTRVPELFRQLDLAALCVDAGPLRDLSRELAFLLNDLSDETSCSTDDISRNIFFSREGTTLPLRWNASREQWQGVRCAPVEFTQREGQGLRHKVARTQDGRIYPLLAAHRDETIQRVITELLPAQADRPRLLEAADGIASIVTGPRFLLPTATEGTRAVLDLYERHLLSGARQERSADGKTLRYLDKCENHFLLATAYAALAELLVPMREESNAPRLPVFRPLPMPRGRPARGVMG